MPTTISQYLRAERIDPSEPVSFYAPGCDDWTHAMAVAVALAKRSRAPREQIYLTEEYDAVDS